MHNDPHHAPKEKTSVVFFVALLFFALYLLYVIVTVPYRYGVNVGLAEAPFKPPAAVDAAAEVFDHRRLMQPTDELIALGARLYATNCATCHGDTGQGDGTAGVRLATRPRSFEAPSNEWRNGTSVLNMYETLQTGVGLMPSFPAMNPRQKYAVIHYVHHEFMQEVGWPEDDPSAIAALPAPGGAEPISIDPYAETRVPIRFAIEKLLREEQEQQARQPGRNQQSGASDFSGELQSAIVKAEQGDLNTAQSARTQ